ncbi:diphthine--ammonia ligase [Paenibacillus sp. HB172176]|uniref:Dph6-related ATP pyrophosphatase n=1 Tax=Paenibacillus sp. HB172176 TaxID=2493690 RepID=UPI00143878E5|nr:diphthine--ammonia ligase [Paenibacillus sp. HB172176]
MTVTKNWREHACGLPFIASYSGGKDSTLALHLAMEAGEATGLIVMLEEEGKRSRSHGMPPELIRAQAEAIGLPVYTAAASWEDYEREFAKLLEKARSLGAEALITGDIDMPEEGCWHDRMTQAAGLELGMPLWRADHLEIVNTFIDLGYVAIVVTVNLSLGMTEQDLGRSLNREFVDELIARDIDPCGEGGEFHTTVIDGPLFKQPIPIRRRDIVRNGEYAFLPLELE